MLVKENKTFPSQGACLALQYLIGHKAKHSSWRKKTVCLISQYLIGHEVKHSSLQEERITHLKYKIPFLETQIVPHLLYWA